ncbi:MAG: nitroreductase family protein [Bacteroidales bacterium]|nr:nitroreductase family protein [Bacteroidales bacterium]
MKTFLELVKSRQSDRSYDTERTVEREKLEYVLEAGRLAPSACNAQPWSFIVIDDPKLKEQTALALSSRAFGMNPFAHQAPVHIFIVEESANFTSNIGGTVKKKHFPHIDIGIAAAHITLAAAEQGLGSCIVGWFDEKKVKRLLDIPFSKRVLLAITLGYSKKPTMVKKRKNFEDVVSYNRYK